MRLKSDVGERLNSSLLNVVLSLLVTSPTILDLTAYSNAMTLLGNLFAGEFLLVSFASKFFLIQ